MLKFLQANLDGPGRIKVSERSKFNLVGCIARSFVLHRLGEVSVK